MMHHDAMTAIDESPAEVVAEAGHIQGIDSGEVAVACDRNWVDTCNGRAQDVPLVLLLEEEDLVVAAVAGNILRRKDAVHNDDAVDASDDAGTAAVVDDQKLPDGTGHHRPMMMGEEAVVVAVVVVAVHELDHHPWNASFGLAEAQLLSVSVRERERIGQ